MKDRLQFRKRQYNIIRKWENDQREKEKDNQEKKLLDGLIKNGKIGGVKLA